MAHLGPILSRSHPTGYIEPPNALMGYPNGLRASLPHLISKQPIFISQHLIFTVFGAYFVLKVVNSKREKWDKNDKKRLEIAKSILFYIHKHCTTSFTSKQAIFTVLNAANLSGKNSCKMVQNGSISPTGPPNALMGYPND